jgi:NAD(P)H dehydrogenase (quinone)
MILVTGAAGITGLALVHALAARGARVRGFVSRERSRERVLAARATEAVVGDLRDPANVRAAMRGAAAVYHICPNMSDAEVAIGTNIIAAAQAEGVSRFVYHSVIAPQIEAMPHHRDKLHVEALLIESGLAYTVLQPAVYMQNLAHQWRDVVERGEYPQPFSADARLTLVDVDDVAEAAARVLTEPGWEHGTFELASADSLNRHEMCAILAEALGRPVKPVTLALADWRRATEPRLGKPATDRLEAMFAHYDRHALVAGNPRSLGALLGRAPTPFRDFVRRQRA